MLILFGRTLNQRVASSSPRFTNFYLIRDFLSAQCFSAPQKSLKQICTILMAGLLMSWPALYNGYPLLYPDSMSYLQGGALVWRALWQHRFATEYDGRSLVYGLSILPLQGNGAAWPIVAFNALVTAYVLWLVLRSILSKATAIHYFGLLVPLSLLTGLGWFVGWIMPDIFGPLLYLSIYLLVFAGELSGRERAAVDLIAWWAAAAHITHLVLAAGVCGALVVVFLLRRQFTGVRLRAIGGVLLILLAAAGIQVALHTYLYGEPSLRGKGPAFLMARIIGDGPGKRYLQRHCGQMNLAICNRLDELPDNAGDFLWADKGIWLNSSLEEEEQLRRDEIPLVLGTLREYPREELVIAAGNFWRQLQSFALSDYDANAWTLEMMDTVVPGGRAKYVRSRQHRERLHEDFFTRLQRWTVAASLAMIGASFLVMGRRWPSRVVGLAAVIAFVVIANAAVTGILSNVEDRYQGRVIWLVPLLAGLLLLAWLDQRRSSGALAPSASIEGVHSTMA